VDDQSDPAAIVAVIGVPDVSPLGEVEVAGGSPVVVVVAAFEVLVAFNSTDSDARQETECARGVTAATDIDATSTGTAALVVMVRKAVPVAVWSGPIALPRSGAKSESHSTTQRGVRHCPSGRATAAKHEPSRIPSSDHPE
jgi:hypothetical protein